MGLRVLFILPACITPAESGPAHVSAGLVRAAAAHVRCEVVGFARNDAEREQWRRFESALPGVALLRVFDRSRGIRRFAGRVRRGLLGRPISMATFDSPALHKWLKSESPRRRWDLVHFDTFNLAEYRVDVGTIPTVLVPHDAYSLGALRGAAAASRLQDRLRFQLKAWSYQRFEKREYRHFGVVAPVGGPDAQWLSWLDPGMRIRLLQSPLASEYVPLPARSASTEPRIVVSGSFTNPAVEAGLEEFLADLYPAIRNWVPSARFTVWGRLAPGARVGRLLRRSPQILHVDHVADYLAFLRSFDIFVYPQRYGAGIQTKVQQAMAVGIPVVARPEILFSLHAQHGVHGFAHEDNQGFAQSVATLALNPSRRREVGEEASALVRRDSSPHRVWESLGGVYRFALDFGTKSVAAQRASQARSVDC